VVLTLDWGLAVLARGDRRLSAFLAEVLVELRSRTYHTVDSMTIQADLSRVIPDTAHGLASPPL
jgi:hypothetical protein